MAIASGFLYTLYFIVLFLVIIKVMICYEYRQLVKANFYINLGIFALLAFTTLLLLNEILGE